jgi:hypothetical protein
MWMILMIVTALVALMPYMGACQEAKATLQGMAQAIGGIDLKTLQYSASGSIFAVGQSPNPSAPWPRFTAKSFSRSINYQISSQRRSS